MPQASYRAAKSYFIIVGYPGKMMSCLHSFVKTMLRLSHYLLMALLRLAAVLLSMPVAKALVRDSSSGAGGWLRVWTSIVR